MHNLTFAQGRFVFTRDSQQGLVFDRKGWELDESGKWVTTDYKAAAQVRRFADEKAEKNLTRAFVRSYPLPLRPLPLFLDEHQRRGVEWILTRSRSYLAHAPGAGKTCQAIVAAVYCKDAWGDETGDYGGQVVFIVPPSLTVNWAREVGKFWELLKPSETAWPSIAIIPESSRQDFAGWGAEFIIAPDSMLTREWVLTKLVSLKKRFVAVDEASRFKDPSAQRTIALFGGKLKDGTKSPGLVYDCRHAVLLDGSPMPNRPMELWAPSYAMSPESIDFMSQQDFGFHYCGARMNRFGQWEFKHSKNESQLRERLQHKFMHVVPEEYLNHPERKRSILFMTGDPRSAEHKKWEREKFPAFSLANLSEDASQGDFARFRRELGERKAPWVADYVADRLDRKNESILLFCWHRSVADALQLRLSKYNPGVVIGGTPEGAREQLFAEFQSGLRKLLILNISAGGRGHNLQRADRVIFAEFSWTDETNVQCEKRASRRGNDSKFVRCEYIVAPNTMDEPILQAVFRKAERVRRIIG